MLRKRKQMGEAVVRVWTSWKLSNWANISTSMSKGSFSRTGLDIFDNVGVSSDWEEEVDSERENTWGNGVAVDRRGYWLRRL